MTEVTPPPIYQPLADDKTGIASTPWILFYNSLFTGDTGNAWSPQFTNLTVVGTSPTITGTYYRLGRSLVYFRVKIIPGTNTSATAGTTFINNFPLKMSGDGACFAVSGLLGTNAGVCDSASNAVYVPSWSAVTVPLSIIGMVEAG